MNTTTTEPERRAPLRSGCAVIDSMSFATADGAELVIQFIGKEDDHE